MNTALNVGRDTALNTEQGLYVRMKAVEAARKVFKGRKLFGDAVTKIDSGAQTYGYDTLTHGSAAAFDYKYPGKSSVDAINLARSTVAMPYLHKEFYIDRLDLLASQSGTGTPLNVSKAESAAHKVADAEDAMIINGWTQDGTTYEVKGLYQSANNSDATALDWGVSANIQTSLTNGIGLLLDDGIEGPWNLTVNPVQYGQTKVNIANTAVTYRQWIIEQLEGGEIVVSRNMTAGTGLMTPAIPNKDQMELVISEDITTKSQIQDVEHGEGMFGRCYVRSIPIVYDANVACKLTTI